MQNLNIVSINNISSVNQCGTKKSQGTAKDSFATVMDGAAEATNGKVSGESQSGELEKNTKDSATASVDRESEQKNVGTADSGDTKSGSSEQSEAVKETCQQEAANAVQDVSGEQEPVLDLPMVESAVKDAVMEAMEMDEETFDRILSEMGISVLQLLNPEVLQQFVLKADQGTDVTELLTSEMMMNDYQAVLDSLQSLDWMQLAGMEQETVYTVYQQSMLESAGMNVSEETATEDTQNVAQMDNAPQTVMDVSEVPKDGQEDSGIEDTALSVEQTEQVSRSELSTKEVSQESKTGQEASYRNETVQTLSEGAVSENTDMEEGSMAGSSEQEAFTPENMSREISPRERSDYQETQNMGGTINTFVSDMMDAVAAKQPVSSTNMQQMIDIVNQVVEKIRTSMQDGATTMEMQLNPENLGKVLLSVTNKNGIMTASFTVESQEAREALESQMFQLRETLEQKDLKVEAVEVNVSDFDFGQNAHTDTEDQKDFAQGDGKRKKISWDEAEKEEEELQAEQAKTSAMRDSGSSIDFIA